MERQVNLANAASRWVGTPFRHNSRVCGIGASCVHAVVAVLEESGFKVPSFPTVPASWSRYQTRSVMEEWMDGHPELLMPIDMQRFFQPGDVVGFKVGLCIHHLGVVLNHEHFFQCNESMGAVILSTCEREFQKRVSRAWRPMEAETV
jgi:cell wall-associated NlpC family hydrolase